MIESSFQVHYRGEPIWVTLRAPDKPTYKAEMSRLEEYVHAFYEETERKFELAKDRQAR